MDDTLKVVGLPQNIAQMTKINEEDLEGEFARFAGDYAYWLWNRAKAQTAVSRRKVELELARADARTRLRDQLEKVKVDDAKAMVAEDALVQDAQDALINAELNEARISAIVEALRAKKDMLVSLGAHQRALNVPGA